ncbi:MAG: DNA repair protein RecO [Chloroflexi bacterium]|nr:DNA repair protein RecO [Chloroflexota bacterium]
MARPRLYRTPAVVLKRMDLGEADRIITLYTRLHGKLRAVGKGVRRTTSRSAGHLEPFTLVDVLLATGRELEVVSQADTISAFRRVREDVNLTSHAYYLAELTDLLTEDRSENQGLFLALAGSLEALEEGEDPRTVVVSYQLQLLSVLGYRPQLRECLRCTAPIEPGTNQFSAHLGGVVCSRCGSMEASARPIQTDVLKLLRHLQQAAGTTRVPSVPEAVSRDAELLMRDYAEQIVEKHLRTPALIARVQQATGAAGP